MASNATNLSEDPRPRDLALLLLAGGTDPPRARARDQQADRAGSKLLHRVLERLAAMDPDPEALEASLTSIVHEFGEPTGATRGICLQFLEEWGPIQMAPEAWSWFVAQAVEHTDRADKPTARRGGSLGSS
ncbi:MAG: hypothetical protein NVSMB9_24090 [Isosphaeraceae bacterium]